jgi:hypothetical protein
MKPWQGLLKKAPAEGKRKNKERRPKPEPEGAKTQCRSHEGKETNYVPEPSSGALICCKKHIEKEKGNLKIRVEQK